jgi:hypothetical protein
MMDKIQEAERALRPIRSTTIVVADHGFEIITFDHIVNPDGSPISIKVMEHEKEGLEAARQAGKRAAQSFNALFKP